DGGGGHPGGEVRVGGALHLVLGDRAAAVVVRGSEGHRDGRARGCAQRRRAGRGGGGGQRLEGAVARPGTPAEGVALPGPHVVRGVRAEPSEAVGARGVPLGRGDLGGVAGVRGQLQLVAGDVPAARGRPVEGGGRRGRGDRGDRR